MNKNPYPAKTSHVVIQAIKTFIGRIRQNPDIYPIRYYKKNRRLRHDYNGQAVK